MRISVSVSYFSHRPNCCRISYKCWMQVLNANRPAKYVKFTFWSNKNSQFKFAWTKLHEDLSLSFCCIVVVFFWKRTQIYVIFLKRLHQNVKLWNFVGPIIIIDKYNNNAFEISMGQSQILSGKWEHFFTQWLNFNQYDSFDN